MADPLKTYTSDVDLLLAEVCMAGAMYGLERHVALIVEHLRALPRTEGAAILAHALAKTVVREYSGAIQLADVVLADSRWSVLHAEAAAFRRLAEQLQAGATVERLVTGETVAS